MAMTVKHIEANGHERLFTIESVDRTPEGELVFSTQERITTGRVYIMNDTGHTVASYDCDKTKKSLITQQE